jgi:hypothetical protein
VNIDPYIVTGVWVSADTSGSVFYPCRFLKSEDFLKNSEYSAGQATDPVYTILSTGGATSGTTFFRFDPALSTCSGGIKIYSVAQPTDMSGSSDKPSLPAALHHIIPKYNAYRIFMTLGDQQTAEVFLQAFGAELSSLTGGKFKMGGGK